LFGGLFGNKQPEQQQQPQQPAVQQPVPQPAPAAGQPGTTDNPEFPPYRVLQKGAAYDLRFFEVFPVVEMDYQRREEGYLALGSYPDGANSSSSRYGHTQPVVMCYHPDVGLQRTGLIIGARGSTGSKLCHRPWQLVRTTRQLFTHLVTNLVKVLGRW
jgi:hypothetical protein